MTSGEFDFVVLVRVPDIAALRDVVLRLQGMPEVRSTQTIFILDEERHPLGSAHHREPVSPEVPPRPVRD